MCVRVCAHQSNWPDASTVLARPLPSAVVPFIGQHCHVTRTSSIRFVTWHLCRYFALITPTHYNGHWRKIDFEGEWCSPASTSGTTSKCYYDCIANVDLLCCCCLQHRRHTHTLFTLSSSFPWSPTDGAEATTSLAINSTKRHHHLLLQERICADFAV